MTDFFMKFLKKNKLIRILFLIILFNFGHSNATNGNINVSQFELEQIQKDIYINFHQNIIFNKNILEGLRNGIILVFDVKFVVIKEKSYWFDDVVFKKNGQLRIKYRNLLKKYEALNIKGEKAFFRTSQEAINFISHVDNWYVGNVRKKDTILLANLKINLNKNHLPKPIQININDTKWNIRSNEITKLFKVVH